MLSARAGQLNIQFENDGVFATDGNYTNGFALSWESKPELAKLDSPPRKYTETVLVARYN